MRRNVCLICGNAITKSSLHDPHLCRQCSKEDANLDLGRFWYLDNKL